MSHADCSSISSAAEKVYNQAESSLEHGKSAFTYVFNFIAKLEKGSGPAWKPTMTGLILTAAPIGKGGSMWVSEEGREEFLLRGKDAVKEISLVPSGPLPDIYVNL